MRCGLGRVQLHEVHYLRVYGRLAPGREPEKRDACGTRRSVCGHPPSSGSGGDSEGLGQLGRAGVSDVCEHLPEGRQLLWDTVQHPDFIGRNAVKLNRPNSRSSSRFRRLT